jgi:hypothetical protein
MKQRNEGEKMMKIKKVMVQGEGELSGFEFEQTVVSDDNGDSVATVTCQPAYQDRIAKVVAAEMDKIREELKLKNRLEYCTQNNSDCETCSLVNYGRDCRNNPVE